MAVKVVLIYGDSSYVIQEYSEGVLLRFIILNGDEMTQLSKLLKEAGF